MNTLKTITIKGFKWDLCGKFITHGFNFILSISLARLLSPNEFGLLGLSMAFITISETLTTFGLNSALIYRKNVAKSLYDSVFVLYSFLGFTFFLLFFLIAPLISFFFKLPELTIFIRTLSIVFLFNALTLIPQTILTKQILFKEINIIAIISTIVSGLLAVFLAFNGYGVYSLIFQQIVSSFLIMILSFSVSKYRPSLFFSRQKIGTLIPFSKNLYFSHIIYIFYTRIDTIIIGRLFNASILGFYYRSFTFSNLVVQYSSGSLSTLLFPFVSKIQDDLEKIRRVVLNIFNLMLILMFFISGMIHLLAKDIILLLYTEKWISSVHILQMLIISVITFPICIIFENTIKGLGYSREILKIEIIKKSIGIAILFSSAFISFEAFLFGIILSSFLNLFISLFYTLPILNIKKTWVGFSIFKKLTLLFITYIITYIILNNIEQSLFRIIIGGFTFSLIYFSLILIFLKEESKSLLVFIFPNKKVF